MRCCYVFLLAVLICITASSSVFEPNPDVDERWQRFKVQFLKSFTNSAEELKRREIWENNIAYIDKHNEEFKKGKHSYILAENKYADMTKEEWKNHLKGKKSSKKPKKKTAEGRAKLEQEVKQSAVLSSTGLYQPYPLMLQHSR